VIVAASAFTLLALVAAVVALLLRIRNARVADRWAAVEAAWEPALLEVLTGERPPEGIIGRLSVAERPYFADFLGRFVRRVTGPERARLIAVARPLLPVIRRGLHARSAEARARAVDTLGVLGPGQDGQHLVAALDDPSPLVAMVAARALARSGEAAHADALVAHLHRFEEWRPSFLAAMLAAMGSAIVPALHRALRDPRTGTRVRTVAAEGLTRLNAPEGGGLAAALLGRETDPELRAALLRLVARVGTADHLPAVRAELDAPEEGVRLAAVRALAALGGGEDIDRLARAVQDPSRWVAEHAARGLAAGAGRETLRTLRRTTAAVRAIADEVLQEETP
jgi:HEAT repeat protein